MNTSELQNTTDILDLIKRIEILEQLVDDLSRAHQRLGAGAAHPV